MFKKMLMAMAVVALTFSVAVAQGTDKTAAPQTTKPCPQCPMDKGKPTMKNMTGMQCKTMCNISGMKGNKNCGKMKCGQGKCDMKAGKNCQCNKANCKCQCKTNGNCQCSKPSSKDNQPPKKQ